MRWDKVERDLVILARDLRNVAESLTSLGASLRQERLNGSLGITRSREAVVAKNKAGAAEPLLPFPEKGDAGEQAFD